MTNHIDLGTVLRQTLSADLYSNLVTRPTGAAVRTQIETLLGETERSLTVIDFSHVSMIDFSCADEVIAKLLMRHGQKHEAYFVFRGVTDGHSDAIETVLERHGLALVVESDSGVELMGVLEELEVSLFRAIKRRGSASAWELAVDLNEPEHVLKRALDGMWRRRLLMRNDDDYTVLTPGMTGGEGQIA
ncbi:MAG TPA: hypothetical protein VFT29_00985 [Gemmatimonadaceae bacterium]|nr:hypothetical protein [Gemmatimonadaceae bacterium]